MRPSCLGYVVLAGLIFLWGAMVPADVTGRQAVSRFKHLGVSDGLPHASVIAVRRDRFGFVWLGTEDGLARFDGQSWIVFHTDSADSTSLSDDWITVLHESPDSTLLVGTRKRGLNRIDLRSLRITRIEFGDSDPLENKEVSWITPVGRNDLIVAYGKHGLWRTDSTGQRPVRLEIEPHAAFQEGFVFRVTEDPAGRLWVGTWKSGLFVLEPTDGTGTRYRVADGLGPTIPGNRVRDIVKGIDAGVFVASSGAGVTYWRPDVAESSTWSTGEGLGDNQVYSLLVDPYGTLWAGTNDAGLYRKGREEARFTPAQFAGHEGESLFVNTLYLDRAGILWVGTDDGVHYFPLSDTRFTEVTAGSQDATPVIDEVSVRVTEEERLVGTRDRGLFVERGTRRDPVMLPPTHGLRYVSVRALATEKGGWTWVGTDGSGVYVLDREFNVVGHAHDSLGHGGYNSATALSVFESTGWIGTFDGRVFKWNRGGGMPRPVFPNPPKDGMPIGAHPAGPVLAFSGNGDKGTWTAFPDRLVLLDLDGTPLREIDRAGGLPREPIISLATAADGSVWAASRSELLVVRDGEAPFRFSPPLNPSLGEGIQRLEPTPDGRILVATTTRLFSIIPSDFSSPGWAPSLVITAAKSGTRTVAANVGAGGTVRMPAGTTEFTLTVSLPAFSFTDGANLSYLVDGFDDGWNLVQGTTATAAYANGDARSGRFAFRAQATLADGRPVSLNVPLVIATPWFLSPLLWWSLGSGVFLVMVIGLRRKAISRRERAAELQRLLRDARRRNRIELAHEIHDSPLQELFTIKLRVHLAKEYPGNGGDDLQEAVEAADRAVTRLREICVDLRPLDPNTARFDQAVRDLVARLASSHSAIGMHVEVDSVGKLPPAVFDALYGVCQNALTNIVRHSAAANAWVHLAMKPHELKLEIRDDGKGFAVPTDLIAYGREGHFGLLGMTESMKDVGGALELESSPGEGTRIVATVPRRNLGTEGTDRIGRRFPGFATTTKRLFP